MAYCAKCGREIPEGSSYCLNCGERAVDVRDASRPSSVPAAATSDDYRVFAGRNAEKYLARFKKFGMEGDERFRFTWHWPAFFVTFGWMMYRKLYGWAILALFSQFIPVVQLFAPILWPLTANYIYYRHAKKKLIEIKRSCQSSETQKDVIAASGGVSFHALAIAAAVALVFIGIMGAIAVPAYLDSAKRNCLYSVVRSVVSVKTAVVAARSADGRYIDCADAGEVRSKLGVAVENRYIGSINVKEGVITATLRRVPDIFYNDVNNRTITLSPAPAGSSWMWGGTVPERYWLSPAKGILRESDEAYNRTVWLDPAVELGKKKDWKELRDWCLKWTKSVPENADAWFWLGFASENLNRRQDAVEAYRQTLRIDPGHADAWNNIGVVYMDLDRKTDAVEAYRHALKIDPKHADAWNNIAIAYALSGDRQAALDALRELRNLDRKRAEELQKTIFK